MLTGTRSAKTQVRRFHQDFYGAAAAEAALAGDFEPREVEKLLGELFRGWENRKPFARLVVAYQDRPVIGEAIEAPDKESAVFQAGLRVKMRDDAPEYAAMVLGNFMTGGGFLNSRLAVRIRQKDGISYGVGSFFNASSFDEDAYFGSYAIYAPQNADKLVAAYREELDKVLREGFTAAEIAEAKQGWLQGRQVSRATDRELARTLGSREYQGRTLRWDEGFEKAVAALTNDQIVAAMRRHIDPAKISMVQSGDFAKVKQQAAEGEASARVR